MLFLEATTNLKGEAMVCIRPAETLEEQRQVFTHANISSGLKEKHQADSN